VLEVIVYIFFWSPARSDFLNVLVVLAVSFGLSLLGLGVCIVLDLFTHIEDRAFAFQAVPPVFWHVHNYIVLFVFKFQRLF
jgi:hypothetical protein